jgi:hypothetical protein
MVVFQSNLRNEKPLEIYTQHFNCSALFSIAIAGVSLPSRGSRSITSYPLINLTSQQCNQQQQLQEWLPKLCSCQKLSG